MTDPDFDIKQQEVDRLLNDPDTPMRPDLIWALLEDLARSGAGAAGSTDA